MANNVVTLAILQTAVKHALAGTPDVNVTDVQIINGALSWLVGKHPWRWKAKVTTVALVQSQSYVALPADFDELVAIRKTGDATSDISPMAIGDIIDARQVGTAAIGGIWYCLDWLPQTGVTLEPTPILQIYPTPTVVAPGTLTIEYLRQLPKLVNGTDVPDMPSAYHELLLVLVRAYAMRVDGQSGGSDWDLFNEMLPDFLARDGRAPGPLGRYRGGARTRFGPSLGRNTNVIQA